MALLLLLSGTRAFTDDSVSAIGVLRSSEEAWDRLPSAQSGQGQLLPSWARILAGELPRTTAALLELDFAHRTKSPVAPGLRAAMRWVAANANHCPYALAYAEFDARRAGLDPRRLQALAQPGYPGWTSAERAALEFARTMTVDSDSVTDAEFDAIVEHFGVRQAAAMVLLLAYANFQDRLLLCLEAPIEVDGPLTPLDVHFGRDAFEFPTGPSRATSPASLQPSSNGDAVRDEADWTSMTYEVLQSRLAAQRRRLTRLRIPSWDEVALHLPDGLFQRPSEIVWYRIVFGYAPELAVPFEVFLRTAGAEIAPHWDRVFGSSLFWVTTRAVKCPYCMGHCEMNWEVAGLNREEIAERSRILAGDDWSAFPPADQRAFDFARKLTRTPWQISPSDIGVLQRDFGPERALAIALNASRYHYMTRISNGFQLTLETENVFYDYYNVDRPAAAAPPRP
jgi:alkylhydroperoxidase family enzyme